MLIVHSPDGLRNLLIQRKPSVFRGFDWERREKKNVGKMYWKNKRKCKYQKLVSIKSLFSVLSSLPQGP